MKCEWEGKGKDCPNESEAEKIFCSVHRATERYLGIEYSNAKEAETQEALHRRVQNLISRVYQHRFLVLGPTTEERILYLSSRADRPVIEHFRYENVLQDIINRAGLVRLIEPGTLMVVFLHPIETYCPHCGLQHIDKLEEDGTDWARKPHRKHLCHGCGKIFIPQLAGQPVDYPTIGVSKL